MEGMERREKQVIVTRLAICVVLALILYFGGEKLCAALKFPLWEKYRPWLEQNKIQAIALAAAAIFGISTVIFPLNRGGGPGATEPPPFCPPPDGGGPEGFEPCEPC